MLKAKHLNKISKLYNDKSELSIVEKEILNAAIAGRFDIELDNNLFNLDIREKLTNKGFTLYHGDITTCISWGNI